MLGHKNINTAAKKRKLRQHLLSAFTLSELLLSIAIIGVVAVLTVPVLLNNIQNRMLATQIKNFSAEIEQLARSEMIAHRTNDIRNTDFADESVILSDKHFDITYNCIPQRDEMTNCWKTQAAENDKVTYKNLKNQVITPPDGDTVILKNGAIVRYSTDPSLEEWAIGTFTVDVNGNDKPNISGRDLFKIYVTLDGHAVDYYYHYNVDYTIEQKVNDCKSTGIRTDECYGALVANNWVMPY